MTRIRLFATLLIPSALLYTATAADSYVGGDHGLFAMVFAQGGYGHAPGYPVWSALLQAFGWLPVESAAYGSSLVAAFTGAFAVAFLGLAARDFTGSNAAALLAAVIGGLSSHVWYMHTMAEVFALHHVSVAVMLWSVSPGFPRAGLPRAVLAASAFALGVAHHHTILFFAPVLLASLWIAHREGSSIGKLAAAFCVPVLGLVPYGFLAWSSPAQPDAFQWGDPSNLAGLTDIFLRRDFGTLQMTVSGESYPLAGRLVFFFVETAKDTLLLPWLLALLAFVAGIRAPKHRTAWAGVLAATLLAGPVFALLLHRPPEGIDFLLVRKFHVTAQFALALPAAVGGVLLARRFEREHVVGFVAIVWAVVLGSTALGQLAALQSPAPEQYARDILSATPRNGVILGIGDHNFIGVEYLLASGERPDVAYVDATMLAHRWYVDWLSPGLDIPFTGENVNLPNVVNAFGEQGRPVVFTELFHPSLRVGAVVPRAPVLVLKPPSQAKGLLDVIQENGQRIERLHIRPRPAAPTTWAFVVQQPYHDIWSQFGDALEGAGLGEQAARAREQAAFFQPTMAH